jgi:protein TonB
MSLIFLVGCSTQGGPVSAETPPPQEGVFDIDQVSVKPTAISQVPPRYPFDRESRRITGEVTAEFVVTVDGHVRDVVITRATDEQFSQAAADAVRQWTVTPAQMNGQAVECKMSLPITFGLGQ